MFRIAFQSALVFLVSGNMVLEIANAPGAAIKDAMIKWLEGTPKPT